MTAARGPGPPLGEALQEQFSTFLASRIGLHFPRRRWPDMLRGVERAAREFARPDPEACMRWLLTAPLQQREIEILASHLTVGETYFYREPAVFAALETHLLPPLIAARRATSRSLRLWSAGCCTGEEAYTLAILLHRLLPDLDQWNISILATDINPHFLARARLGEYREWSFRGTPAWFKDGYFTLTGDRNYQLKPAIRRLVHFAYLNLVDDVYPALENDTNGIDLLLCRNVLMYFEEQGTSAVLHKLRRALMPDGWLALSVTESGSPRLAGFSAVAFPEATLYRKDEVRPPTRDVTPTWPEVAPPRQPSPIAAPTPTAPTPADATYRQALDHYAAGDYARAAAALRDTAADQVPSLTLAARAWANLGRLADACRCCQAAVAADKCDPALRYLLATLLTEQGSSEAAATALKQALYLDPDFVLAHFALGNLCRRLDQPAQAARHWANARRLLAGYPPGTALPAAEGLTAGRLLDIIDQEGASP